MKKKIRELFPELTAAVLLTVLSAYLLGGDVWTFWTWWLLALFMGMVAMPVTGRLFGGFEDRGWLFSKVLAIAVTGFLTWLLVAVEILTFTAAVCVGVSVAVGILCAVLFHVQLKHGIECYPSGKMQLIFREELLFFGIFLLWTYLAGFRPQAYGTEKFMDYGFMEAMMRSKTLPARDLWYSQGTINYYYGGQYFAVFLTKLTGSRVEVTYNLMRTFVAAFAFVYYRFKGKEFIFNSMLLTFFIPITVLIMPNYLLVSRLGLLDTPWGVMLPGLVDGMGIFLMRQTMRGVPKALLEAAILDGARPHQVLCKVILPLIKPSVIAIAILFFINSWNEYFWPLLILQDKNHLTLPLALQMFISAEGGSEWGVAMAVATLTSLPPLLLYIFFQKFIINTFMQAGVKG